ncbi:YpmS family protein [Virgibacillus halodenitrificans]|uniref:YpmS family protein n=1 Tax=Virgibacillus halodenitrificans TaxID=1482 RepID=UPI001F2E1EC0|nr:YpmS family protein [Virgibacillus halodenitrificans]MCG1029185.1 YpmS family protein [Virgibacillus halodenitrificans]
MTTRTNQSKRKSKWKKLFFTLLIVNILLVVVFVSLIFWPVSKKEYAVKEETSAEDSSVFVVRTTKNNLNELVNAYIGELNDSKHQYKIELEEDVHLIGELPVFSSTVPLSVHLEPLVQENGDIILKLKSISVGLLQLPNKKIMEYMGKYLPMPEWVTVNPKEEEIYVAVTDMKIKSNFEVAVEQIDLDANNLAFKIKVPYKTLGIEQVD